MGETHQECPLWTLHYVFFQIWISNLIGPTLTSVSGDERRHLCGYDAKCVVYPDLFRDGRHDMPASEKVITLFNFRSSDKKKYTI